jgi:hypothetical protein
MIDMREKDNERLSKSIDTLSSAITNMPSGGQENKDPPKQPPHRGDGSSWRHK